MRQRYITTMAVVATVCLLPGACGPDVRFLPTDASVPNDDMLEILTTPSANLSISEDGTTILAVRLSTKPMATIAITLISSDTLTVAILPATLTFTAADWDNNQIVTVASINDADLNHASATITVQSDALPSQQVDVSVADDDLLSAFPGSLEFCGPGRKQMNVTLGGPPFGGSVTLNAISELGSVSPTSFQFTEAGTRTLIIDMPNVQNDQSGLITISGPFLAPRHVGIAAHPACDTCGDNVCSGDELAACSCLSDCNFHCP